MQRVQCCEVCGVVAHDGTCARKAAHDCRPVTEASDSMVHLWQPAGTIYYDSEVRPVTFLAVFPLKQNCSYKHEPPFVTAIYRFQPSSQSQSGIGVLMGPG